MCRKLKTTFFGRVAIIVGMAFILVVSNAAGQACCSGGVPLGGSLGLGSADQKSLQFLVTYDQNVLEDLVDISEVLEDDSRKRLTHSIITELNYGIGKRLSVAAVIPYVRQERIIKNSFSGNTEFTVGQGLGDMMFLIKYTVLANSINIDWQWTSGVGPKIPTGKADLENNNGFTMPADMQPGSGSLDLMIWNFIKKDKLFISNLSWLLISTYQINGENESYNDTQIYHFGNSLQLTSGFNYNFFAGLPLDVFVFGRYRTQPPDLIDGRDFPGSGGEWISIVPGFNLNMTPNFSLRGSVQLPVYRKLKGAQLTTTYRTNFSLFYNLNLQKEKEIKFD